VESTDAQSKSLLEELRDLLDPKPDMDAGRVAMAAKKEWMLAALTEKLKDFTIPDDTVRESER
jgi:hypothetical protein